MSTLTTKLIMAGGSDVSITSSSMTRIITPGSGTQSVPTGALFMRVTVVGGGAGGDIGGGGGGGCATTSGFVPVADISYTVGAGGLKGSGGSATAGGTSTASWPGHNLTATGGQPSGNVSVGGTGSGGTLNFTGGSGGRQASSAFSQGNRGGGGGAAGPAGDGASVPENIGSSYSGSDAVLSASNGMPGGGASGSASSNSGTGGGGVGQSSGAQTQTTSTNFPGFPADFIGQPSPSKRSSLQIGTDGGYPGGGAGGDPNRGGGDGGVGALLVEYLY